MQEKKMHTISWDAYEYEYKHKGRDWFWGVGIITTALAVSSVVLGNITFAGVIVASAIVLTLYGGRAASRSRSQKTVSLLKTKNIPLRHCVLFGYKKTRAEYINL